MLMCNQLDLETLGSQLIMPSVCPKVTMGTVARFSLAKVQVLGKHYNMQMNFEKC